MTSSLGPGLVLVCISSNYIEFCIRKTEQAGAPDCVYCYDLALHSMGGYSNQCNAWSRKNRDDKSHLE